MSKKKGVSLGSQHEAKRKRKRRLGTATLLVSLMGISVPIHLNAVSEFGPILQLNVNLKMSSMT